MANGELVVALTAALSHRIKGKLNEVEEKNHNSFRFICNER